MDFKGDSDSEPVEHIDETDEESNDGSDCSSPVDNIATQPRVPLHNDPEFQDPNQSKYKYGVIYLSYIPEGLNVKILRELMSQFGEVGRIYLEPEGNNKKRRNYAEGWIEFKKKRDAKSVAKSLNGTPLQYGRKHCKFNGQMWSIKYLHRFKWAHLTQQLAHDRAVKEQKRRFEMSQTKKQVEFYQKMTERAKFLRKTRSKKKVEEEDGRDESKTKSIRKKQKRPTDDGNEFSVAVDDDLLNSIFKKVA